jgi:hypothetical protein
MEICYGCMHRFEEERPTGKEAAMDGEQLHSPTRDEPSSEVGRTEASAEMHASTLEYETPRRSSAHKDTSRVFGAVADEDRTLDGYDVSREDRPYGQEGGIASPSLRDASLVMLAVGPIASASLGNGYRLVVGIERE